MTAFYGFHEAFNGWVDELNPSDDFRFWVMAWLWELQDDVHYAADLAPEIGEPWWFVKVPNAEDDRRAVVSLYSIEGDDVRCAGINSILKPTN